LKSYKIELFVDRGVIERPVWQELHIKMGYEGNEAVIKNILFQVV
jgi:hypothetical protein